jgi:drug/metabolite transporter (DMT)-like permease
VDRNQRIGVLLTILGAVLWGVSGNCVQYVQSVKHITPEWLLTIRLLSAGTLTVIAAATKIHMAVFRIFFSFKDTVKLCIFGIFGMAMCQYSYFRSIEYSGPGIATVLQYLAPVLIILYTVLRFHKKPTPGESISVVLAMAGTAIIALQGSFDASKLNNDVLFWGLLSAFAVAIYSVQPVDLLREYGTGPVVGWATVIGGIVSSFAAPPWDVVGIWDWSTGAAFFGIAFLGTFVSFNAYMEGVRRIGAIQGSIIASLEPISSALVAWIFLGNALHTSDIIGFCLILSTIFILAYEKKKEKDAKKKEKLKAFLASKGV